MSDQIKNAGEPTVGPDGPPIQDVSGSVKVVGSTIRQNRDPGGRWRPRGSTLIRGLGQPGEDRGGNAVLFRDSDDGPVHYLTLDHSRGADPERRSQPSGEDFVNHVLGCPACAVGGFVHRG